MTTVIACRPLGVMVADTRISHGELKFRSTKKVQRCGAYLVGIAGDLAAALEFVKVFARAAKKLDGHTAPRLKAQEIEGEIEMVVMSEHGLWYYDKDGAPVDLEDAEFYVAGTGGSWATASLFTQAFLIRGGQMPGYDLTLAMRVACEYDNNSDLPMIELSLKDLNDAGGSAAKAGQGGDEPRVRRTRQRRPQG